MASLINMQEPISGTANTTSTEVMIEERARSYLLIQNKSSTTIMHIKFGSDFVGNDGIEIGPGGNYEPVSVPLDNMFIKTIAGTAQYVIVRGK